MVNPAEKLERREGGSAPTGTVTITEAAKLAGVSRQAIAARVKRGDLQRVGVVRAGQSLAGVRLDELEELYPQARERRQVAQPVEQRVGQPAQPVEQPRAGELGSRLAQVEADLASERERRARAEGRAEAAQEALEEARRSVVLAREEHAATERNLRGIALELGQERGRLAQLEARQVEQPVEQPRWPAVLAVSAVVLALGAFAARSMVGEQRAVQAQERTQTSADNLRDELAEAQEARADALELAREESRLAQEASQEALQAAQRARALDVALRSERAQRAAQDAVRRGPLAVALAVLRALLMG